MELTGRDILKRVVSSSDERAAADTMNMDDAERLSTPVWPRNPHHICAYTKVSLCVFVSMNQCIIRIADESQKLLMSLRIRILRAHSELVSKFDEFCKCCAQKVHAAFRIVHVC